MSGGALDYVYWKIDETADKIPEDTPHRRAFRAHLKTIAATLRAIEWNMSGDGDNEEEDLIIKCTGFDAVMREFEKAK